MTLKLGDIDFGAPDANQEYSWSLASGKPPAYMQAFVDEDLPLDEFKEGRKWIALGLKGSGKTALLRHISQTSGTQCEYIIFRDEIAEEKDIFTEAFLDKSPIILQSKEIHECKHYHHIMKRLLSCIILGKMPLGNPKNKGLSKLIRNGVPALVKKILSHKDYNVVSDVFDSVADVVKCAQLNPQLLAEKGIEVDVRKILKRENDRILEQLLQEAKRLKFSVNLSMKYIFHLRMNTPLNRMLRWFAI